MNVVAGARSKEVIVGLTCRTSTPNLLHNRGYGHHHRDHQQKRLPPILAKGCAFVFQFSADFVEGDPIAHHTDGMNQQWNIVDTKKKKVYAKHNHWRGMESLDPC